MRPLGNDRYEAVIEPTELGAHEFVVEGWTDRLATWRHEVTVKLDAGQTVEVELEEGALPPRRGSERVDRAERARVQTAIDIAARRPGAGRVPPRRAPSSRCWCRSSPSCPTRRTRPSRRPSRSGSTGNGPLVGAWYELFPRSYATADKNGFQGAADRLPAVADMGFDVVYLPPIHPIGTELPEGPEQHPRPRAPDDPGSPWAIGGAEGGHTALHPELGTLRRLRRPSWPGPGASAWRSPSTTPSSAPPSIPG